MINDFLKGIKSPYNGAKYLIKNKNLAPYIILPISINIIIYILFIVLSYSYLPKFLNNFYSLPESFWGYIIYYIQILLITVLVISVVIFSFTILANIIAAPFNEFLCRKIMKQNNLEIKELPFLKEVKRIIFIEIKKALILIAVAILAFLIALIPFPLFSFISYIIVSSTIAYNYLDYSLEVDLIDFQDRTKYFAQKFFYLIGMGIVIQFILIIPILSLILLPTAVTGACLNYIKDKNI
jgi:CysZ protein